MFIQRFDIPGYTLDNANYYDTIMPPGKRHFESDQQRFSGWVGEMMFIEKYPHATHISTEDQFCSYDFVINRKKIDVKTSVVPGYPQPKHYFMIAENQYTEDIDYYVFLRIDPDHKTCFFCGWINAKSFKQIAVLKNRGERIEYTNLGMFRHPTLTCRISQMNNNFRIL